MSRNTTATVICLLMMLFPRSVHAGVIFSNVLPNPEPPHPESFELLNDSTTNIDISGWEVWDSVSTPSLLFTLEAMTLSPQETVRLELSSAKLNNSGDTLRLLSKSGEEVAVLSYENAVVNQTFSNNSQLEIPNPASPSPVPLSDSPTPTPSPAAEIPAASQESVIPEVTELTITQILSCPKDTESESVVVSNFSNTLQSGKVILSDAAGNSLEYDVLLSAGESHQLSLSRSILNNSGDTIFLRTDSTLLDTAEIPACTSTTPFMLSNSGIWQQQQISLPQLTLENTPSLQSVTKPATVPSPSPAATHSETVEETKQISQTQSYPWDSLQPLLQYERNVSPPRTQTLTRRLNQSSYYLGGIIGSLSSILAALRLAPFSTHEKRNKNTQRPASSHSLGSDDLFTLTPGDLTGIKR